MANTVIEFEKNPNASVIQNSYNDLSMGKIEKATRECRSDVTEREMTGTECNLVEENNILLNHVACQLEYYFSKQNLSRDTYVQTLRDLNDGCVPVFILANFTKIKAIVSSAGAFSSEDACVGAIVNAVTNGYTQRLELSHVDSISGKIVPSCRNTVVSGKRVLVVGPISRQPLELDDAEKQSLPSTSLNLMTMSSISHTIIMRDVPPLVTEDQVRSLFNEIPECPPVIGITKDVAHCWFVTLLMDSREIMMNIMMQLRCMTLGGEYVMARLKASNSSLANIDVYNTFTLQADPVEPCQLLNYSYSNKKKKKTRPKKCRNRKVSTPHVSAPKVLNSKTIESPICLSIEDFPSLREEKKVEWEMPSVGSTESGKITDDDCKSEGSSESPKSAKPFSDGASTATTISSSAESVPNKTVPMVGYAAALMKPPPSKIVPANSVLLNKGRNVVESKTVVNVDDALDNAPILRQKEKESSQVFVASWGQRLSFADILRQER